MIYQYINGDLNSSAASFYEWGEAKGTWHPLGSGYVPQPGDVAVYGLDASQLVASHVAVVIAYEPRDRGPTAVNGDGDSHRLQRRRGTYGRELPRRAARHRTAVGLRFAQLTLSGRC